MLNLLIASYIVSISILVMTLIVVEDRRPGNWKRITEVSKLVPWTATLCIILNILFAPFVAVNCLIWMAKGCKC